MPAKGIHEAAIDKTKPVSTPPTWMCCIEWWHAATHTLAPRNRFCMEVGPKWKA